MKAPTDNPHVVVLVGSLVAGDATTIDTRVWATPPQDGRPVWFKLATRAALLTVSEARTVAQMLLAAAEVADALARKDPSE